MFEYPTQTKCLYGQTLHYITFLVRHFPHSYGRLRLGRMSTIYIYIYIYIYTHTNTHTHTHIFIYIIRYIILVLRMTAPSSSMTPPTVTYNHTPKSTKHTHTPAQTNKQHSYESLCVSKMNCVCVCL